MILEGRAFCFGDHIDTDAIIPARYLTSFDPAELAPHCLEGADASFSNVVQPGDFVVAGENFGCGSSREHAALALKGVGVGGVIAASFARIFYRNAINVGLPIMTCPSAVAAVRPGDLLAVDLRAGRVDNRTRGGSFRARPYPPFLVALIKAGGLIPYAKAKVESTREPVSNEGRTETVSWQ